MNIVLARPTNCFGPGTWNTDCCFHIDWNYAVVVVHYEAACDGYVLSFGFFEEFLPSSMLLTTPKICPVMVATPLAGVKCQFRIRDGIIDENGHSLKNVWVDAEVIMDTAKSVLVRLVDYPREDWWQGYCMLPKNSNRLRKLDV